MSRRRGQDAAKAVLLDHARTITGKPGARLPSMATLAEEAGVSQRTMWAASRELVDEGVLAARRGDGLYVNGAVPSTASAGDRVARNGPRLSAWESTRDAIRGDIRQGGYRTGELLPSVKELCSTYAASYRTARKALSALVGEQLLQPRGSRHRVRTHARPGSHNRIALVTRRFPEEAEGRVPPRHAEDLMLFESECRRLNLQVSPIRLHYHQRKLHIEEDRDQVLAGSGADSGVLGFVLWPITLANRFGAVWLRLLGTGKPVAITTSNATSLSFLTCPLGAAASVFRTGHDYDAGVAMAHHLLAQGHTRIAFVSAGSLLSWVDERLVGMRDVFAAAGHPDALRAFAGPPFTPRRANTDGRLKLNQKVAGIVGDLAKTVDDPMASNALQQLQNHTHSAIDSAIARRSVLPQCRQAHEWGEASAYVGANDEQALVCLSYLRGQGIPLDRISVAGFDNTREAMLGGLTTYDFGVAAAIYRSIDFVLRPWSAGRKGTALKEEWAEGQLVDRGSVREAG